MKKLLIVMPMLLLAGCFEDKEAIEEIPDKVEYSSIYTILSTEQFDGYCKYYVSTLDKSFLKTREGYGKVKKCEDIKIKDK